MVLDTLIFKILEGAGGRETLNTTVINMPKI
jgi:hypothetical protein